MIPDSAKFFTSVLVKSWSASKYFVEFAAISLQSTVKFANNGGGSALMVVKATKLIGSLLPPHAIIAFSSCF